MATRRQFLLLLWKNFTLQKRKPISTFFELFVPAFLTVVLLLLRVYKIHPDEIGATSWPSFTTNVIPLPPPKHESSWKLAFGPNTSEVRTIMETVTKSLDVGHLLFDKENDMEHSLLMDEEKPTDQWRLLGGIYFETLPGELKTAYKIRLSSSTRNITQKAKNKLTLIEPNWYTEYVFPVTFDGLGPRSNNSQYGGPPHYYQEGFLAIQKAVDTAIIKFKNPNASAYNMSVELMRYPYPHYLKDPFIVIIQGSFPLFLMLSLVYPALSIVKNIVYEKEKKLKESMKMMGLSSWLHWVAWFTKCFLFLLIPMSITTALLTIKFGSNGSMLNNSDPSVIFVFLILYSISAISFCFCISTFFYRANIAAAAGGISWFLSYTPYFFLFFYYNQLSLFGKVASCLDFQVAMAFGAQLIGKFEGQGQGVQWSNLNNGVTVDDNFSFLEVLIMFVVDTIVYGLITWYVEGIYPGEFGLPRKWNFPFTWTYWMGEKRKLTLNHEMQDPLVIIDPEEEAEDLSDYIESEPQGLKPGIVINHLKKVFKIHSGHKTAVNDLTLKMYEGQITAVLGHNGAGKTTTVSMLTGLVPPTSGSAVVNGFNIATELSGVRTSLGICPQHNILFDLLTVHEHLWFFAKLKGMTSAKAITAEVDRLLSSIGLLDKRDFKTSALSGGMKRKLSVGIALIADSKIVILDEPTSGMDPSARRFTWDLLQREKRDRTLLLTTHFMDEADLLGDRIAILAEGSLRCCGSSLFLKSKYGVGYHMVLVKDPKCDVDQITTLVKKYVCKAELENNVGLELSYILPSEFSHCFENLFTDIESHKESLGIASYGASVTTMEEVFLKVGRIESEHTARKLYKQLSQQTASRNASRMSNDNDSSEVMFSPSDSNPQTPLVSNTVDMNGHQSEEYKRNSGMKLFWQRWYAMLVKRILHWKRHKSSIIAQLLIPGIFTILAITVSKTFPKKEDSPPRIISVDMFGSTFVPFSVPFSGSSFANDVIRLYEKQLVDKGSQSLNVSNYQHGNVSQFILDRSNNDLGRFNAECLVSVMINATAPNKQVNAMLFFNNHAYHSPAVSLSLYTNAVLKHFTNSSHSITTINHPLPRTAKQSIDDVSTNQLGFQIAFSLVFGMAFLASSFVVFLVQERASKAKHIQFVSGVDVLSYWSTAFIWDLVNFLFPLLLIVIIFVAFDLPAYSGSRIGFIVILLFLYAWAIIPLMYIASFFIIVASSAFVRLSIFNIVTGLVTMLTVFVLSIPQLNLLDLASALKWAFLVLPNYSLGQGLIDLFNNYNYESIFNKAMDVCLKMAVGIPDKEAFCHNAVQEIFDNSGMNLHFESNYLAWKSPGIGRYLVFLAVEGILFFIVVLLLERKFISRFLKFLCCCGCRGPAAVTKRDNEDHDSAVNSTLDSDVAMEREHILHGQVLNTDFVLELKDLSKVYGKGCSPSGFLAVDGLCLGVPRMECFGLLGINGAGKTTTFKMITGDESISGGEIYVNGCDTLTQMAKVRQCMGYCPQFDALIDLMTGRELLTMYARLRGVCEQDIPWIVTDLASRLSLENHVNNLCKSYSGGNKRKLSTAIALVGDPAIVFLDEPTTGMDPAARRMLWDALVRYRESGKSIVITSHSMEECEALCTRLAMMVNGQFKCLGSSQHLKNKFSDGYTLLARIGGRDPDTSQLKFFIRDNFPGCVLKDEHSGFVHYQLSDKLVSWAQLFGVMEKAKNEFNIEDYSVSQTTLDQVFLNFAKGQHPDENES